MGITFAARMLMWGAIFGGGDDERGNMLGALAMMILAPIAAALSRWRCHAPASTRPTSPAPSS